MGELNAKQTRIQISESIEFTPDLTCFMPAKLRFNNQGQMHAVPKPTNTSGDFVSLAGTDGIIELRRGQDKFPPGYAAPFFPW
jgi:molybdopterin molybdotransferase